MNARRSAGSALAARRRRVAGIVVRRATPKDLMAIVDLRLALLREERRNPLFADPHPGAAQRAVRLTRAELAGRGQVVFVAARGDQVVGVLRCRAVRRTPLVADSRQAVVTTVYVLPAERRRGVLRALLDAADRWCRRHHLSGMRLQCSLTNDVGQKAWSALGFTPVELLLIRSIPQS